MNVLYFLVGALIGIPLAVAAINYSHAKHHHREHGSIMWHG